MKNLLALLLLLPPAAFAQNTIELTFNGSTDVSITAGDCSRSFTGAWTWPTGGATCLPLTIWATAGECGDTKKDGDVTLKEEPASVLIAAASGNFTMKVADLPAFKNATADGGVSCGAAGVEKEHLICASTRLPTSALDLSCSTSGTWVKATTALSVLYDTKPPGAPTIGEITSLDGAISVAFTVVDDTSLVHVDIKGPTDADFFRAKTVAYTSGTAKVTGLTNGTTYSVRLFAEDSAGNVSPASEVREGSPVQTDGFWDIYKRQGGDEPGGCSMAPASLSLIVGASLLLMMRLGRRRVR